MPASCACQNDKKMLLTYNSNIIIYNSFVYNYSGEKSESFDYFTGGIKFYY